MSERYVLIENGAVTGCILWDGESDWAPGEGVQALQSDTADVGWTYTDGEFVPPAPTPPEPLSPAEILANNTAMRDYLLGQAAFEIAPLQDAVDLDEATDAETAALKRWKSYRVAVNRVDLSAPTPAWPVSP